MIYAMNKQELPDAKTGTVRRIEQWPYPILSNTETDWFRIFDSNSVDVPSGYKILRFGMPKLGDLVITPNYNVVVRLTDSGHNMLHDYGNRWIVSACTRWVPLELVNFIDPMLLRRVIISEKYFGEQKCIIEAINNDRTIKLRHVNHKGCILTTPEVLVNAYTWEDTGKPVGREVDC